MRSGNVRMEQVMNTIPPLAPTMWRTCRALANTRRLTLFRKLVERTRGTVAELAEATGYPEPSTSLMLRQLQARGLLHATRSGREVYYRIGANPDVAHAEAMLQALLQALPHQDNASICRSLTAFTHTRRITLARLLAAGLHDARWLAGMGGMSRQACLRHMAKLVDRGYVVETENGYRCVRPAQALDRALWDMALHPVGSRRKSTAPHL